MDMMSQPNPEAGPEKGNQEDIVVTEESNSTETSNEKMQINEEVNPQQENTYTKNEQIEGKRLYSQAVRQSVARENRRATRESKKARKQHGPQAKNREEYLEEV
ncbi:4894_t:CDS:2 [Gigaspora margarita]|uniref:4894_t:CDS:1 n=1 Tax=Gigaspora margarita TaxID=4874 RepID=A0ABN7VEL6_GIGMA|nr:4894_t:CDS:2 [Gigaspora margarita]